MHDGKQALLFIAVSCFLPSGHRGPHEDNRHCRSEGGAGKSTLARNLAVAATQDGLRVLAMDLDPQQSFRAWWQGRDSDAPMMLLRIPRRRPSRPR